MSPQPLGKVSIEEVISEDPALVRLIYQYLAWAAFWLVAASAVGLVLSLKLNYPDFLNSPFTVFGRLRPVHTNTLFWGWTSLAMVGLCLFVVPRTSRTPLYSLKLARISLWLWNTAVLAGWVALGPYWRWRSVGGSLMFLGHVVFAYNLYMMRPAPGQKSERVPA